MIGRRSRTVFGLFSTLEVTAVVFAAGVCLALAVGARPVVSWIFGLPLPVFPGGRDPTYYAAQLRAAALVWSVFVPAYLVAALISWRWFAEDGNSEDDGEQTSRPGWLVVVLIALVLTGTNLLPRQRTGDEPAYLLMAQSLARDGDLDVPEAGPLLHPSPNAVAGRYISRHPPGMSLLLAVPVGLFGEFGARACTVVVAVLLIVVSGRVLKRHVAESRAHAIILLMGVTFPIITYSGFITPDLTAALLLGILFHTVIQQEDWVILPAVSSFALCWLNSRYLAPAVFLALWDATRSVPLRRSRFLLAGSVLGSLGVMAWFHLQWFGSPSPIAAWPGPSSMLSVSSLVPGILGILVDQEYGALIWSPILAFSLIGLAILWARNRRESIGIIGLVVLTVGPGILVDWHGGWSPAARFVVPVLCPLILVAGLGLMAALDGAPWQRRIARAIVALQLAIGFVAGAVPGKVFGTFEPKPRNYFLDLVGRVLHVDTTWIIPSLRRSFSTPTVLHAALLVSAWLIWSGYCLWEFRGRDRDAVLG